MGSLRISAVIVSMGLVLIGSAAAHGETYSVPQGISWSIEPYHIQIGDFNGDGYDDIFNPWPEFSRLPSGGGITFTDLSCLGLNRKRSCRGQE